MIERERDWDAWHHNYAYGDMMRRRALGIEPEMEAAKQLVRLIKPFHQLGMRILDVGCGGGHFVRSLRHLDPTIRYTGMDLTGYYLAVARDVWQHEPDLHFACADVFNLPIASHTFDLVTSVTVLQNLPEYQRPLSELVRVSRGRVLVRLLLGEITHVIQRYEQGDRASGYTLYNIWNCEEVLNYLYQIGVRRVDILPDEFHAKLTKNGPTSTWTYGNLQINGNVVMTWKWIQIVK